MIASKIIEKIFFLWNFFNFLINNRIKSWENLKTCNDFLKLGYWDWTQFLEVKKQLFSQLLTGKRSYNLKKIENTPSKTKTPEINGLWEERIQEIMKIWNCFFRTSTLLSDLDILIREKDL